MHLKLLSFFIIAFTSLSTFFSSCSKKTVAPVLIENDSLKISVSNPLQERNYYPNFPMLFKVIDKGKIARNRKFPKKLADSTAYRLQFSINDTFRLNHEFWNFSDVVGVSTSPIVLFDLSLTSIITAEEEYLIEGQTPRNNKLFFKLTEFEYHKSDSGVVSIDSTDLIYSFIKFSNNGKVVEEFTNTDVRKAIDLARHKKNVENYKDTVIKQYKIDSAYNYPYNIKDIEDLLFLRSRQTLNEFKKVELHELNMLKEILSLDIDPEEKESLLRDFELKHPKKNKTYQNFKSKEEKEFSSEEGKTKLEKSFGLRRRNLFASQTVEIDEIISEKFNVRQKIVEQINKENPTYIIENIKLYSYETDKISPKNRYYVDVFFERKRVFKYCDDVYAKITPNSPSIIFFKDSIHLTDLYNLNSSFEKNIGGFEIRESKNLKKFILTAKLYCTINNKPSLFSTTQRGYDMEENILMNEIK